MGRAIILVLDSVGVGGAPDAAKYGDVGADTLGHIADYCAAGRLDGRRGRSGRQDGPLQVPNLVALGLGEACRQATSRTPPGLEAFGPLGGSGGCAVELSTGKDSQSGHWEIAGSPVEFEWGYFPKLTPCFPQDKIELLCRCTGLDGILGNKHASGTEIIAELGVEHMRTGRPICYTSADSVFHIAAHEETFGLERLYKVCASARELLDDLRIGRVIARPFIGDAANGFKRTENRRDYGVPPPPTNLLYRTRDAKRHVISVGKIGDLFCHSATGLELHASSNAAVFDCTLEGTTMLADGGLLFANFVDFDTLYGHRRDPAGYAGALEAFDARLPELQALLRPGDLCIVTGDHGCDPTWPGSDHTRECIPIVAFGPRIEPERLGRRGSFADIGATVAAHLQIKPGRAGTAFLH
jgi:phosphopentomutase